MKPRRPRLRLPHARRFAGAACLVLLAAFLAAALPSALLSPGKNRTSAPSPPADSATLPPVAALASPTATPQLLPTTVPPPSVVPSLAPTQPPATRRRATPTRRTLEPDAEQDAGPTPTPTPSPTQTLPPATLAPTPTPVPSPVLPYFGVALQQVDDAHGLAQAAVAGVRVTRISELNWDYVEPVRTEPPTYLWDKMSGLEQELVNAAQAGIEVTLLVMYTPLWARQVTSHACSPIREDALDEYAQFLRASVERYSRPPYNIHAWELYNEPDVEPGLVKAYSGIGCWGDAADPFYGGRAFGRMLVAAYPAIKQADPSAQVIVGGLLLDNPDAAPAAFAAGILEAGAGDSFDLLAFHAYTWYFSPATPESDRRSDMPWSARGGVVAGKAQFLRDVLAEYGVSKPLLLNEAGIGWLGTKPPPAEFPAAQGDYVTKLYTRGRALGLAGVIWYGWEAPGWRHMALLNPDLSPRPGMAALAVAVEQFEGSAYAGTTGYEGVEGYAFRRAAGRLHVVWPASAGATTLRIPLLEFRRAIDSLGNPVPHAEESGEAVLTLERPTYVELAP